MVFRQLAGHAVGVVRELAGQAVDHQDRRAAMLFAELAYVQARARHVDEAALRRQHAFHLARGVPGEQDHDGDEERQDAKESQQNVHCFIAFLRRFQ
jgi:hypothetical protein